MRVISQDGNIDVAYKNTLFVIDGPYIHAYHPARPDFCMCMGLYEDEERAKKAMETLREECMDCNREYTDFIPNMGVLTTTSYVRNWVFQLPADDEVTL